MGIDGEIPFWIHILEPPDCLYRIRIFAVSKYRGRISVQVTAENRILTLSTCSDDLGTERRVVHAKLVEEVRDGEQIAEFNI